MRKNITLFCMLFMMLHTIAAQNIATAKTGVFNEEKQTRTELTQQPIDISGFVNKTGKKAISSNPIKISESFEDGTFPPFGWEISSGTSVPTNNWGQFYNPSIVTAQDGNYIVFFNCYENRANQDGRLTTPAFLPTAGDATFSFYFNFFLIEGNYGNSDRLFIDAYDVDANEWYLGTENIISGQHGAGWIQKSIDLSNYLDTDFTGKTVRMRFRAISAYGSYCIGIDNVTSPKRLIIPTNLIVSSQNNQYGKLPKELLPANLRLKAHVQNVGTELTDATDLKFTVKTSTNSEIYTDISPITVPMGFLGEEEVSSVTNWNTGPVTTGSYTIGYEALHAESDQNDKTDNFPLEVTDYLYARDIGTIQPGGVGSNGTTITMGLPYEISSPQTLSGVQIHWATFTATTNIGFKLALYNVNSNFLVQSTVFESEELYKTPDMSYQTVDYYIKPQNLAPGIYILALKQTGATNIGIGYDATAYGYTCIANNAAIPTTFSVNSSFGSIALRMDLTPKQTAIFNVTSDSNPVENAVVTVKQGEKTIGNITANAAGNAEFWLEKGSYTYSVLLDGYIPINNAPFTVTDDMNIPVTLQEATLDATITGISSPAENLYSGVHDIVVTLKNVGKNTITVLDIDYDINGTTGAYNWTGSLAQNQSEEVTIVQDYNFDTQGEYTLTVSSRLTGDLLPDNDEFTTKVNVFNFTIPYAENFDGVAAPNFPPLWSIEDANNDAKKWQTISGASYSSPNAAYIDYNSALDMDDWLFTPQIEMKQGKTYKLEFYYACLDGNYPERLKVHIGQSPSSTGMNASPVIDLDNINNSYYLPVDEVFTVEADGKYHIGFHGYSEKDKFRLVFDNVSVTEVPGNDISLESVSSRHLYSPTDEITIAANVMNVGINSASCNVTLEVKNESEQLVKTLTLPVADLSYKQTETLTFEAFALPAGMYTATVTANWNEDENTENNVATKVFQVLPDHIIGYDDFENTNAIGVGAVIYDVAIKFLPEDMVSMNSFGEGTITHISAYINQLVNAHTIKIWQGENAETEVFSQDFIPIEGFWNVIALNEPYRIDPTKELWVGFRYDGIAGIFPAGVDKATSHNMKSNLYRTPLSETNPAWRSLQDGGVAGDYNIQLVTHMNYPYKVTFDIEDQDGAPVAGAKVTFDGTEYGANEYTIMATPGTYDYSVVVNEYETAGGEATVVDKDVTINVKLQRITGVENSYSSGLTAYPNPFKDKLYINNASVEKVTVFNLLGQKVKEVNAKGAASIETTDLSSGCYILIFESASGERTVLKMSRE